MNAQVNRRVGGVARPVPTPPTCRCRGVAPPIGGDTSDTSTHPTSPQGGVVAGNPGTPGTRQRDTAGATEPTTSTVQQPGRPGRFGDREPRSDPRRHGWPAASAAPTATPPAPAAPAVRRPGRPRPGPGPGAPAADHSPQVQPCHGPFCGPWTPQHDLEHPFDPERAAAARHGPAAATPSAGVRQRSSAHRDPAG
jgi:hypothetical protein